MALTRADVISQTQKKINTFSDFLTDFVKHPITNSLVVISNEQAVTQALKNLIMTNLDERLFNPNYGTNIRRSLFDNFGPFAREDLTRYITTSIQQYEKRVNLLNVTITDQSDNNAIGINIVFSLINNTQPLSLNLSIKRVR